MNVNEKFDFIEFLSSAWAFVVAAGAFASFGSIAVQLRAKDPLPLTNILGAVLYSFMVGAIIALALFEFCSGNRYLLLGLSGLAGIGTVNMADVISQYLKNGVNISITTREEHHDHDHHNQGGSP